MSRGAPRGRRSGRGRRRRPERERGVDLDRYRGFVPDWPAFLEAAARPEPTVLRVRRGRIEPEVLVDRLQRQGYRLRSLEGLPDFFQIEEGPKPISGTVEHWLGLLYVQQASTGVAAPALGPRPGERVLDLCAAPGGKTTHICQLMDDRGCVVASEISEPRIRGLLGNVYRLGHANVLAVAGDGRRFPEGASFDRVLLDAPCSGEGTLRRRSGRAPDPSPSFRRYVTGAQRALLERAVRLTRPGGVVLYVTCTFAPEENEAVVSEALERLPVSLEPLRLELPHAPGLTAFEGARYHPSLEGAARIYPHHFDSGGLFLARLRKDGGAGDPSPRSGAGAGEAPGGGVAGSAAGGAADVGWSAVPVRFPSEEEAPGGTDAAAVRAALEEVTLRYGIDRDWSGVGWTVRGGRVWAHTVGEWPLEAWEPGAWRAVSIGLRSIEFDSRGRPRPTNDFLRWAPAGEGVAVSEAELRTLLQGGAVQAGDHPLGPVAVRLRGDVLGRGVVTRRGLVSEIPKARAKDLLRVLEG